MIVFSFLSLHNLRSNVVHQILPSTMQQVRTGISGRAPRPKRNGQLMRLSLVQVLVFVVLNSGWTTFALFVLLAKPATFGALNLQLITVFVNSIGFTLLYIYGAVSTISEGRENDFTFDFTDHIHRLHDGVENVPLGMYAHLQEIVDASETMVSQHTITAAQ